MALTESVLWEDLAVLPIQASIEAGSLPGLTLSYQERRIYHRTSRSTARSVSSESTQTSAWHRCSDRPLNSDVAETATRMTTHHDVQPPLRPDVRPDIDLLDPAFHVGDPHPAYRWMRSNEPVYRDRNAILCVTRLDDVRDVERRDQVFVSDRGYRSLWTPEEVSMISKNDPEHMEQRRLVTHFFTPPAVYGREDEIRSIVIDAIEDFPRGPVEIVDGHSSRPAGPSRAST